MKKTTKINIVIWAVCLVIIGITVISMITLKIQINEKKHELERLRAERNSIVSRIEELKYELEKPIDDDYIIKIARQRLGYHLPGEKVYIFENEDE